ncbi:hypothetical protein NC651_010772 [Populus alba x Populus x berolinensis]|nr:hypothetical protein NC651_010772 [Populus alba x Populus x berolinensis]
MTKSKAKSLAIRSGQGDFQLQSKRCPTSHTARVQSRSCSLVQSPSPTSIPPRSKQLVYESLPRFFKQCKSLGYSTLTCTKGHVPCKKKRPHDNSASSSPFVETAAVEKQDQYCTGPSVNLQEDPISTEVVAADPTST